MIHNIHNKAISFKTSKRSLKVPSTEVIGTNAELFNPDSINIKKRKAIKALILAPVGLNENGYTKLRYLSIDIQSISQVDRLGEKNLRKVINLRKNTGIDA
ncbi:hypothetical protein ACF0H5_018957 [Mactra antiquata]